MPEFFFRAQFLNFLHKLFDLHSTFLGNIKEIYQLAADISLKRTVSVFPEGLGCVVYMLITKKDF